MQSGRHPTNQEAQEAEASAPLLQMAERYLASARKIDCYTHALESKQKDEQKILEARAACYVEIAEFEKAIADYEQANSYLAKSSNYLRIAELHLKKYHYDLALLHLVSAVNSAPVDNTAPAELAKFLQAHANKAVFDLVSRRKLFAAIQKLPTQAEVIKYLRQCSDPVTPLGKRIRKSKNAMAIYSLNKTLKKIRNFLNEHDPLLITVQPFSMMGPVFFSDKPLVIPKMPEVVDEIYKL